MRKRNTSIEILRIVATYMILISHITFHGLYIEDSGFSYISNVMNKILLPGLNMGNLGVDIFVIITGYFMITHYDIGIRNSLKRVLPLVYEVWFYSICILVTYILKNGLDSIDVSLLLKAVFPVSYGQYWFFTSYILISIFAPYINACIKKLSKNEYEKLITIIVLLWAVMPVFIRASWNYNDLALFIMLYIIGGYLRLYGEELKIKKLLSSNMLVIFSIIVWFLVAIIMNVIGVKINFFAVHSNYFYQSNSILTISVAIVLFFFCINKETYIPTVNKLSRHVFAAYLLTDHSLIRDILWKDIFNVYSWKESEYLIPYIFLSCLGLLILSIGIDIVREYIAKCVDKIIKYKIKIFRGKI